MARFDDADDVYWALMKPGSSSLLPPTESSYPSVHFSSPFGSPRVNIDLCDCEVDATLPDVIGAASDCANSRNVDISLRAQRCSFGSSLSLPPSNSLLSDYRLSDIPVSTYADPVPYLPSPSPSPPRVSQSAGCSSSYSSYSPWWSFLSSEDLWEIILGILIFLVITGPAFLWWFG